MEITEAGTPGLAVAPQNPHSMMSRDFPDPPVPPQAPASVSSPTPEPPSRVVREIDLGDGSGKQVFEGANESELIEKLVKAQEHATRRIRELSSLKRVEPERDVPGPRTPKPMTQAEMLAMKEGFQADPVAAFNRLFEAQIGESPEQVRAKLEAFDAQARRTEAEQSFISKHREFYNCPENAQKINALLSKEGLQVTKRNLEYAYQELQADFVKAPGAEVMVPNLPPPPAPPGQPRTIVRDVAPPPVSIPGNFGERPIMPTNQGGLDDAEISRIAALSPVQMKARIEQLFREQRGSAR